MALPDALKARLEAFTQQIERLEAEQTRVHLEALEAIQGHMETLEDCENLLDILPAGFLTYKVRQQMGVIDPDRYKY